MAYYGMNFLTCRLFHHKMWEPFIGQYWCPICETIRGQKEKDVEHAPSQDKHGWQKGAALVRKLKSNG